MKWYWILTIVVIAVIVGFWLSRVRMRHEPIKANTQRIIADLQSELDNINNWLSGKPNDSDPNYAAQRNSYQLRRMEIINSLKTIYGCTVSIDISKGSNGSYYYTCVG